MGRDTHTHTHTRLTALCPGLPGWAGTRKVKITWILLKQETVSGSEICWAICKSAPCSRQITTPAPHRSVFLQAGCRSCRPTNSVKALNGPRMCFDFHLADSVSAICCTGELRRQKSPHLAAVADRLCCRAAAPRCSKAACADLGPDLQNVLRQSYDYLTIMPTLRSTYDGRLIYKTSHKGRKAFLRYNSLAKL